MLADNKVLNIVVGSVAGIIMVGSLIFAVTYGIHFATAPLAAALKDTGKLTARVDALAARIDGFDSEIKGLKAALAERPQARVQEPPAEDVNKVYDIPVGDSYVLGKPDARITIVEFADFQCPFCARFHPLVVEAQKTFPNDVKVIIKNLPLGFHPNARPAAKAALAAGLQGKYHEMADILIAAGNELSDEKYKEAAGKIGLNVARFLKDLKDKDAEFDKQIEADLSLAREVNVQGTPTYFINGKNTSARSTQAWASEIRALLAL